MILLSKAISDQAADLLSAAQLWTEWAHEKGHADPDTEAYLGSMIDRARSGRYCVVIEYGEDSQPRGMVDVQVDYEPGNRKTVAYVDKLFVGKAHRGTGRIALRLSDAAEVAGRLMGAEEFMLAVKPAGPTRFYERKGFKQDMTIMRTD